MGQGSCFFPCSAQGGEGGGGRKCEKREKEVQEEKGEEEKKKEDLQLQCNLLPQCSKMVLVSQGNPFSNTEGEEKREQG